MKAVIAYESTHHRNTLKLVKAITDRFAVDTINVMETNSADLTQYDFIGLASGIAFGKFYKKIEAFAAACLPEGKKVFLLYTCGKDSEKYSASMRKTAADKKCRVIGCYSCAGYDTFGPFKLIGGINRNRPNESDRNGAADFFEELLITEE